MNAEQGRARRLWLGQWLWLGLWLGLGLAWIGCLLGSLGGAQMAVFAQEPASGPAEASARPESETANLEALLKGLVLDAIPHTYQKWDDWGRQAEQFTGVAWRRDPGGKLETKRQWTKVNDGIWRMYSAELIDPAQTFEVKLENLREQQPGIVAFDLSFIAALNLHGRQAQWIRGVQLYSFSAEGSARVRLRVGCELGSQLDLRQLPPVIQLKPVVRAAELRLDEFRIDRVSILGGEFDQQLTAAVRGELDDQLQKKSGDLVEKLNRELQKNETKLKISLKEAAKLPGVPQAKPFLPGDVRDALGK
ncbi:MAG: hypothetical protein ACK55S_06385 [Planctomycetota bacterium]